MADPSLNDSERAQELAATLGTLASKQQERLAQYRAQTLGVPYVSLVLFPINSDVLDIIPKERAQAAGAVVFYKQGKDIRLGVVNPSTAQVQEITEQLEKQFGVQPQIYAISHRSLQSALGRYRKHIIEDVPEEEVNIDENQAKEIAQTLSNLQELGTRITSLPPTEILNAIVISAVNMGASDIHIEPKEKKARLRFRIDGVLQDITEFDREGWSLILSRIKVKAKLKLNIHETPQDGSFVLRIGQEVYDMRVSVLPGGFGENIVIRLLDRKSEAIRVQDLGMKQRDYAIVEAELKRANGMILVTGPTGSGKTTTLISFIREVNRPEIKVITLEDPIEYRVPGIEQTQVEAEAGYTFSVGLRSILRQDPDVILVGEMRDTETAETAVHAALTGHLVFSTLHTNNAAGAVPRLMDIGIQPFTLGPALNMIIAQRLVRVVCKSCAREYKPDRETLEHIQEVMEGVRAEVFDPSMLTKSSLTFLQAVGCDECGQTGYRGRVGVFEIFSVHGRMEELVLQGADQRAIQDEALAQGMTTVAQDAYLKVFEHITTIDEVQRISEE